MESNPPLLLGRAAGGASGNTKGKLGRGEESNPRLAQKIARLPKPTRDMLNLMLDDGLPYHVIIEELGETAQGLNPQSLAKWVQSGYEEYLKERTMIEAVKTQAEYAADLLRELGGVDASVVHRACMIVASLQMFKAIRKYGNDALKDMLRANPGSYLNILNTLCKMVQPTIDLENHRREVEVSNRLNLPAASSNLRAPTVPVHSRPSCPPNCAG